MERELRSGTLTIGLMKTEVMMMRSQVTMLKHNQMKIALTQIYIMMLRITL